MNVKQYLVQQGWRPGEALRPGALRRPILVRHKNNTKGLGSKTVVDSNWLEHAFDCQLKNLDVTKSTGGLAFEQDKEKLSQATSPLYRMFVPGGSLEGTLKAAETQEPEASPEKHQKKPKAKRKSKQEAAAGLPDTALKPKSSDRKIKSSSKSAREKKRKSKHNHKKH